MKKLDPKAPVTNQTLLEAVDTVISAMDDMIGSTKNELKKDIKHLDTKIDNVKKELKREIRDLKTDTPTQKEFNQLKAKVYRHHPTA